MRHFTGSFNAKLVAASLLAAGGLFICIAQPSPAQQTQFVEDFVLAKDRAKALEQLVPGTEDYYYFHALNFQINEQFAQVDGLLKPWIEKFGYSTRVQEIRNRQALLQYSQDPQKSLNYLIEQLNLHFNHQRQIPPAEQNLANSLDQSLFAPEALLAQALQQFDNTQGIETAGLHLLADKFPQLSRTQRRHLLARIQFPDFPKVVDMIVDDFRQNDAPGFGAYPVHLVLTLEQLDALAKQVPAMLNDGTFIQIYCSKLLPSDDVNPQVDQTAMHAYLERVWAFVEKLEPAHNSLKAAIRYHQLALDRQLGNYDLAKFLDYLKLPRHVGYINPKQLERVTNSSHFVDMNADYRGNIRIIPIYNDQPIVLDYLDHFLVDAQDTKQFGAFFEEQFLRKQFATVKILNGMGDVQKWTAILSPEEYQALLERVDIEFAPNSPHRFTVAAPVKLQLKTKNVKNLLVKIFEINTENFYRQSNQEINTDVNLDGLVPNWQQSFDYDSAPALLVPREFTFDQLDQAGVYIIDFIGNGKSSRALIRKGQLSTVSRITPFGHEFTVIDEAGEIKKQADLWLDGRRFTADEDGTIDVPFSTQPKSQSIIVRNGSFCCLDRFVHTAESYELIAGIYIDREALLKLRKAPIVIRPSLRVAGTPIPIGKLLEKIQLRVTSTNQDGISSIKTFDNLALNENGELVCEFQSPPRLNTISIELTAEIRNASVNETQKLATSRALTINQIDRSDEIGDVHLVHSGGKYLLEARGLSGELRRKQPVGIIVKPTRFTRQINVNLQSNDQGLIDLGELIGVDWIKAAIVGGSERSWQIAGIDRQTTYQTIHAAVGQTVFVAAPPTMTLLSPEHVGLFELRAGKIIADRIKNLSLDNELLSISNLTAGDYLLAIKSTGQNVTVRVTSGQEIAGVLRGPHRSLELRQVSPLHIEDAAVNKESITLKIGGAMPSSRVHIFASRFVPRLNAYDWLGNIRDIEPALYQPGFNRNAYMSGRMIGDEYQYILNRKQAQKFAGNMLERPSLLLNPWSLGPTDNREQALATGGEFGSGADNAPAASERPAGVDSQIASNGDFSNLDFLDQNTIVLSNLRPDEQGNVVIPLDKLGEKQHLVVVVADLFQTVQRTITLPAIPAKTRDLRLAEALAPADHLSLQKNTDTLLADAKFTVNDILTAKFQAYDDLGDVYRLLLSFNGDAQLREFQFLLVWGDLDLAAKRALYSKYACHELNFFVYKKDPEFFQTVVQPFLKNKYQKTFVDHWLIGDKLDDYLDPWKFNQLNVFEKILLSQRLEAHRADILRHIVEQYQVTAIDRAQLDYLYDAAVASTLQDDQADLYKQMEHLGEDAKKALPDLAVLHSDLGSSVANGQVEESVLILGGIKPQSQPGGGGGLEGDHALRKIFKGRDLSGKPMDAQRQLDVRGRAGQPAPVTKSDSANRDEESEKLANDPTAKDKSVELDRAGDMQRKWAGRFFADEKKEGALREQLQRFYQRIKPTEEWVENDYYRLRPEESTRDRLTINGFWLDYANLPPGDRFLSNRFPQAHRNFSEVVLALALIDLPSKAKENKIEFAERSMNWTIGGPMIMFHQQIRPALFDRKNTTILVSENFFQKSDRYRFDNNLQFDKFISEKFSTHTLYGGQVVITNPTSTPQIVQLLIQIPEGAIAASGSQETRTVNLQLPAFNSQSFEYYFYFPTAGQFTHYPAHVADSQRVLSMADALGFNVVDEPVKTDLASWEYISQNGTADEVVEFLGRENLIRLDLSKIAFRMGDPKFFERIVSLLRERHVYNHDLWSYSMKHNVPVAIREFLSHADNLLQQCGMSLQSELLNIDPVVRKWYEQREFWPLVNIRAHEVGRRREILNSRIYNQYHQLLSILSYRTKLNSDDQLAVVYYLLLQDRVAESLERFAQVNPDELASRVQYDYCAAYLKMYEERPGEAAAIANKYVSYPVDHWQKRFAAVAAQVAEIGGADTQRVDADNNAQLQTVAAATSESFQFEVADGSVSLDYENLDRVTLSIYEMDAELLFSRNPFTTSQQSGFSMIRPNATQVVSLDPKGKKHKFDLPAEFKNRNVLVEIGASEQSKSQAVYANDLNVQVMEAFGQLKATAKSSSDLLPKTYVKVYAQRDDGSVIFFKDGYTDLRGRFDYVTQSNIPLDGIQQLALLILSDDHGTVIRTVGLPKE